MLNQETFTILSTRAPLVEVSGDGKIVALGDGISRKFQGFELRHDPGFLSVYEWPSAKLLQQLRHAGSVQIMKFSKDNRFILTVDDEGAKVWEIKSGSEVFRVRNTAIKYASFADDEKHIVVVAEDPARGFFARNVSTRGVFARRFLWTADDLLGEACRVLPLNLDPQEWATRMPEEPYHLLCPSLPDANR